MAAICPFQKTWHFACCPYNNKQYTPPGRELMRHYISSTDWRTGGEGGARGYVFREKRVMKIWMNLTLTITRSNIQALDGGHKGWERLNALTGPIYHLTVLLASIASICPHVISFSTILPCFVHKQRQSPAGENLQSHRAWLRFLTLTVWHNWKLVEQTGNMGEQHKGNKMRNTPWGKQQ